MATGAPFEGTSEAIPAAAETGLEPVADSFVPAAPVLAVVGVFTNVLVPISPGSRKGGLVRIQAGEREVMQNNV